jgi:hypothetical protein
MLAALGGLVGAAKPSISSASGDASAGLDAAFNYQGAFQVGGSGTQTQAASQSADNAPAMDKTLIYAGLGVAALIVLVVLARK